LTLIKFDHIAPIYDHFMLPFERGALKRWRRKLWEGVKGGAVLEVGVGTGANLPFYPEGGAVVGLDRSVRMLRRARGRGLEMAVLGDVEALPFGDATFDDVVSTLVFCSVGTSGGAPGPQTGRSSPYDRARSAGGLEGSPL